MKSNLLKYLSLALALLTLTTGGACGKPEVKTPPSETPEPANISVRELAISPDAVMPNDEITVTATIDNTGGTEGTYTAILSMDGQELERKDVLIGPGATNTAVFKFTSPETNGDYKLSVGEASANFCVLPWVAHTIQYDDLEISGGLAVRLKYIYTWWGGGGFLSHFEIPGISFRIKSININGDIRGLDKRGLGERSFSLRIWDNKLSQELYSADYPYSLFGKPELYGGSWVKVQVPELRVDDDFYVEVIPNAELMPSGDEVKCGLYICLCLSVAGGNADLILNGRVQPWDTGLGTKETAAWAVRVEGESGTY